MDALFKMARSWKTTLAAVGLLLHVLSVIVPELDAVEHLQALDWNVLVPEVLVALGLLAARDGDKTSEDVGAKLPLRTTIGRTSRREAP